MTTHIPTLTVVVDDGGDQALYLDGTIVEVDGTLHAVDLVQACEAADIDAVRLRVVHIDHAGEFPAIMPAAWKKD